MTPATRKRLRKTVAQFAKRIYKPMTLDDWLHEYDRGEYSAELMVQHLLLIVKRMDEERNKQSAISYVGNGPKGPHVIYLAEGKRITVGRDKSTKGPAWLVIEDTPVVTDGHHES